MLKARPRALPRCADRPDPLATLDRIPDLDRDLREVAVDCSEAGRVMVDDDDQPAQIPVVSRHRDVAVGRREHVSSYPASDVETSMRGESRIALRAQPVTKARQDSGGPVSRGHHRTHKVRQGQEHEERHRKDVDDQGEEVRVPFSAATPGRTERASPRTRTRSRRHRPPTSPGKRNRGANWAAQGDDAPTYTMTPRGKASQRSRLVLTWCSVLAGSTIKWASAV